MYNWDEKIPTDVSDELKRIKSTPEMGSPLLTTEPLTSYPAKIKLLGGNS